MSACRNPQRIGEEVFPPVPTRQDTLRVEGVEQVFLPPPLTRNSPFAFIGEAEDTFIGRWSAGWATNFALGGANVRFLSGDLLGVDSVVLELFIASSYGDFSVPMRLRVERLLQPLSTTQSYTTETTFLTDGQNLTIPSRDSLYFTAVIPGAYRFRLDTSLGHAILSLPPSALANERSFQQAFPGLYITATPFTPQAKSAIYTISPRSTGTVLRVYYRERIQGQEAPQRYDFFITDSCVWAHTLVRQGTNTLRDEIAQDSNLWRQKVLLSGGLPVGVRFRLAGWEKIARRPLLFARFVWPSDSGTAQQYSPLYPRPNSLVLYADTIEEVAAAAWGFGDFSGNSVFWELTQSVQEVTLGRRNRPTYLYLWLTGRTYTLQRWIGASTHSSNPPYLIVASVEP